MQEVEYDRYEINKATRELKENEQYERDRMPLTADQNYTHNKKHKTNLKREALANTTRIFCKETCPKRLEIMKAMYINKLDPQINKQTTGAARIMKLRITLDTLHLYRSPLLPSPPASAARSSLTASNAYRSSGSRQSLVLTIVLWTFKIIV